MSALLLLAPTDQIAVAIREVFKYSVPIGTATAAIAAGELVHLHNLRSDYIATRRERA
jgi:hypothetical protein